MQWRKESLLALKVSRSRITAPGKDNLWLVTELRLTGRERQLLRHSYPSLVARVGQLVADVVEKVLVAGDPWDNSCELSLTRICVHDGATATGPERVVL
jgi:hypothetical protein